MSLFIYQAVRRSGEKVIGELDAQSRAEAYQKLDRENLQPIRLEVKQTAEKEEASSKTQTVATTSLYLTNAQTILFTEELGDLLEAGLRLEPALGIMEQREELSSLKSVTALLRQQVREGASFSAALRSSSSSFGELYCSLVAAGELSGALPQILRRQARYLATLQDLQNRVGQALIYPAFITGAGILLLAIFMTVLVPQLTMLFTKTGQNMPLITRMLIGTGNFMGHYWWALLILIALTAFVFWQAIQRPPGRRWWDKAKLRLPIVGAILTAKFYAQFAQTLATLVGNGVPLLNGLRLMGTATTNVHLRDLLRQVIEQVSEGATLSRALKRVGYFPPVLIDITMVGEQTGDLAKALEKVASRYDKELDKRIQRLTALIQPVVIIIMALVVGLVAYAIVTGIFQAVSGLKIRH